MPEHQLPPRHVAADRHQYHAHRVHDGRRRPRDLQRLVALARPRGRRVAGAVAGARNDVNLGAGVGADVPVGLIGCGGVGGWGWGWGEAGVGVVAGGAERWWELKERWSGRRQEGSSSKKMRRGGSRREYALDGRALAPHHGPDLALVQQDAHARAAPALPPVVVPLGLAR